MKLPALTLPLCLLVLGCSMDGSPTEPPDERESGITANYKRDAIDHLALSIDSTVKLMSISTHSMNVDGTAKSWSFRYSRTLPPLALFFFTATFDSVFLDSTSSRGIEGAAIITQAWVNSDVAIRIAESEGGKVFRSSNPDCSISASLGEAVVPNPIVSWYVMYRSNINTGVYKVITVDARPTSKVWKYGLAPPSQPALTSGLGMP